MKCWKKPSHAFALFKGASKLLENADVNFKMKLQYAK